MLFWTATLSAKSNGNSKTEETTFPALVWGDSVSRFAESPSTSFDLLFDLPTNDWARQK